MGLLVPLGLLGLLGILVLIIIYIIKPKYHEQFVSSTVIWRLSLKFQKRKMPIQWITRSLLFIVQLLILISLALMLARPYLNLDSYSGEKVFIIDASASMQTEKNGTSRFDRAIEEIKTQIEQKNAEDKITVIFADSEASYAAWRDDSVDNLKQTLSKLNCTFEESNVTRAVTLANSVLNENPGAEVILYTDCDYEQPGYVNVKNMSAGEWNAALSGLTAELKNGYYEFNASVSNYGKDAELSLTLSVDDVSFAEKKVFVKAGETTQVIWGEADNVKVYSYASASVELHAQDDFVYDHVLNISGDKTRKRNVELVSEYPGILNVALSSNHDNYVYAAPLKPEPIVYDYGYDVYIYEGELPDLKKLPEDGAIVLINPKSSALGVNFTREVTGDFPLEGTNDLGPAYKTLMRLITPGDIRVTKYIKADSYSGYDVLMTCNGDPVFMTKQLNGITVVVLLFDIHHATLPNQYMIPMLMKNICDYTAPSPLAKNTFETGENVKINVKPNAEKVEVKFESLSADEPVVWEYSEFPLTLKATDIGFYTITQHLANGKVRTDKFFVRAPYAESDFLFEGGYLASENYGDSQAGDSGAVSFNILEFLPYIIGFCLILVAVEWGLQYREQF